jgi:hypothetical protein
MGGAVANLSKTGAVLPPGTGLAFAAAGDHCAAKQ